MLVYEETSVEKVPMLGVGRVLSANARFDILETVQRNNRRAFVVVVENPRDYVMLLGLVEASVSKSEVAKFRELAEKSLCELEDEMAKLPADKRAQLEPARKKVIARIEQLGGSAPVAKAEGEPGTPIERAQSGPRPGKGKKRAPDVQEGPSDEPATE